MDSNFLWSFFSLVTAFDVKAAELCLVAAEGAVRAISLKSRLYVWTEDADVADLQYMCE